MPFDLKKKIWSKSSLFISFLLSNIIPSNYSKFNFKEFLIAVGYKEKIIKDYFKKRKLKFDIKVVDEYNRTLILNGMDFSLTLQMKVKQEN